MTGQALHVTLQSAEDITPDVLTSLLRRHDPVATVTDVTIGHEVVGAVLGRFAEAYNDLGTGTLLS